MITSAAESVAPLSSHLDELRHTLLWCLLTWLCTLGIFAFYYQPLVELFLLPYRQALYLSVEPAALRASATQLLELRNTTSTPILHNTAQPSIALGGGTELCAEGYWLPPGGTLLIAVPQVATPLVLGPAEGFGVALRLCLWASFLFSAPLWGMWLLQFIAPAFPYNLRCRLGYFACIVYGCLLSGLAMAYWFTLPLTTHYLWQFNAELGQNAWQLERYTDYALLLLFAHGSGGILVALLFAMLQWGFVQASTLAAYRRHVLLGTFIVSALLTPPDLFSQVVLAVPLYLLFEAGLLYGYWREGHFARRQQAQAIDIHSVV